MIRHFLATMVARFVPCSSLSRRLGSGISSLVSSLAAATLAATLAVVFGLFAAASDVARAASLFIDDTASNDTITISATGFFSFIGGGTFAEGTTLLFSGTWDDGSGVGLPTREIFLVEAGSSNVISDIVTFAVRHDVTSGVAILEGSFTSDSERGLLIQDGLVADVFVENGTAVHFDQPNLSFAVQSDVPEPGSVALLGLGLGLLPLRRFVSRKRR
jgi:hypothetical protein